MYAHIRPGTDAALQNTMINHILVHKLYDEDYVVTRRTPCISATRPSTSRYSAIWHGSTRSTTSTTPRPRGYQLDAKGKPRVRPASITRTVVFSRLDLRLALHAGDGQADQGITADQIRQIAELMANNQRDRFAYALGMTRHEPASGIRWFTILQLLLGNIGKHRQQREQRCAASRTCRVRAQEFNGAIHGYHYP